MSPFRRNQTYNGQIPGIGFLGRLIIAGVFMLSSGPVSAGQSAGLALSAGVAAYCDVTVTETGASINLTNDYTDLEIASITEDCNHMAGYTVTITSANGIAESSNSGMMGHADSAITDNIPYTVKYDDAALSFVNGVATGARSASGKVSGYVSRVTISFLSGEDAEPGSYGDTLDVTVILN
jgi:spore coat protein U-like protein